MKYTSIHIVIEKFLNAKVKDYTIIYGHNVQQLIYEYKKFEHNFLNKYVFSVVEKEITFNKKCFEFLVEDFINDLYLFYSKIKYIKNNFSDIDECFDCDQHYINVGKFVKYSLFRVEFAFCVLGYEITTKTDEIIDSLDDILFLENVGLIDETIKDWNYDYCAKLFLNSIVEFLYNPNIKNAFEFNDLLG